MCQFQRIGHRPKALDIHTYQRLAGHGYHSQPIRMGHVEEDATWGIKFGFPLSRRSKADPRRRHSGVSGKDLPCEPAASGEADAIGLESETTRTGAFIVTEHPEEWLELGPHVDHRRPYLDLA